MQWVLAMTGVSCIGWGLTNSRMQMRRIKLGLLVSLSVKGCSNKQRERCLPASELEPELSEGQMLILCFAAKGPNRWIAWKLYLEPCLEGMRPSGRLTSISERNSRLSTVEIRLPYRPNKPRFCLRWWTPLGVNLWAIRRFI